MKSSNNKSIRNSLMLLLVTVCVAVACSRIYDNIEKFVDGEIVYIDKLDGILRVQVGYERVEIDLLEAGRIPSSQINMAKATKTVIECSDFTEPGNRRVIDSICSWVNITGLTQLKYYEIIIYTEDEAGNRSLPMKVSVRPYTAENLNSLEITPPNIIASPTSAQIEWVEGISAVTHQVLSYVWQYTDREGVVYTNGEDGDSPVIFLENVATETDIPVSLTCKVIPTISNSDYTYTPIIDTLDFQTTLTFRLSSDADEVIFLKAPIPGSETDVTENFPLTFSWTKTEVVDGYSLKFSLFPNFPETATYSIDAGDVNEYVMNENDMLDALNALSTKMFFYDLYWTVMPTEQGVPVKTSFRLLKTWKAGVFFQYDRSEFEVIDASSIYPGTTGDNIFDNNISTVWHSYTAELPHWLIIDMKSPKNIFKFDIWRTEGALSDTKRVELYIGNTTNPNGSWIKIGEGGFAPNTTGTEEPSVEILTFDNVTEGRYLRLNFLDGRAGANPYVNVCELYLYYK